MSYSAFADYYDRLTQNVKYIERVDYLCGLMQQLNHEPGLTLDLACGTGSLTLALAKRGIDVYGIDGSVEMLSVARQKAADEELDILFLCQKMQSIDLYGTVDTVICALDSINHMTVEKDVQNTFNRVSLFMNPGGYFIFDINTIYKHKNILANKTFVYDMDDIYCVWQNHFEEQTNRVSMELDFFAREGNKYLRSSEHFYERAYSIEQIVSMLRIAGFEDPTLYDDLTFHSPDAKSERIIVAAKKL